VDLYSPGYDFVYGEADVHCGVATLSTFRLISENPDGDADQDLFEERVIREATHEVGHLFGMDHCENQRCLMRTCTCVSEVDQAGNLFCNECEKKLKNNLNIGAVA
jgi:archaemetzincin